MSRKNVEVMVEMAQCPKCGEAIGIDWSSCYDPECCGIDDSIECEGCEWKVEGYFNDLDVEEFRNLVPEELDQSKTDYRRLHEAFKKSDASNREHLRVNAILEKENEQLKNKIKRLESEIRVFENKYGSL